MTSPGSISLLSPTSKLSTPPAKPSSRPAARSHPPAIYLSSYVPPVPHPSVILPPSRHTAVQGYWVVTVGQEVGIFYSWSDVAERTDFISGNRQHKVSSSEDALAVYTRKYNEGSVRAVPTPGGPFWPPFMHRLRATPPTHSSPSPSGSDSDELWSQVDELVLSEKASQSLP
ncbi:hypothetical protein BU15DRAFT_80958 [Melanogaster broomeanus]|nr:hypothetical protein BU15DRAFT_80958 [Melanogaster broomeanus]